jgi:hypothetical protein
LAIYNPFKNHPSPEIFIERSTTTQLHIGI